VRVRTIELRLIAAVLSVGWTLTAGLVLLAYRPGGPLDLVVGLAAALPIPIAIAGLLWPPVARSGSAFAAFVWLGLATILVMVPAMGGVVRQLATQGPQTLVPSLEAGYPWLLALLGTALFSGLGIARHWLGETAVRRRRLVRGALIAVAATSLAGVAFAGAALANELTIRDRPTGTSRFGPVGADLEPPMCDEPMVAAPAARVEIALTGQVDGRPLGSVDIEGVRSGADVRWRAFVATTRQLGQFGAARVAESTWLLAPATGWQRQVVPSVPNDSLDREVLLRAIESGSRPAAETHGLAYVEGALARHCRIAIDGLAFAAAFPQVQFLVGRADLSTWRGELDYWVFADRQLGRASGGVSGHAGQIVEGGLRGQLRATMIAVERNRAHDVVPPAP
jgi:hypothetical protein